MSTERRLRVAYIAHGFPLITEHYVREEIDTLRSRGIDVVIYAVLRKTDERDSGAGRFVDETVYLSDLRPASLALSAWLCVRRWRVLSDVYARVLFEGSERPGRRLKALLHTWAGVYLSVLLKDQHVTHMHAHHGYLASWAALVAARMLGITFSITLHGSDLLVDRVFLDLKVKEALFLFTVSEYNRRFLLGVLPSTGADKILVARMGAECGEPDGPPLRTARPHDPFVILTVGALRAVKNQEFLVRGCAALKARGHPARCLIIGDGTERRRLARLIRELGLDGEVGLLGFLDRRVVRRFYEVADLFVLTSRSEGIPMVLMEAMTSGTPVLAPRITGIPELVSDGDTGFLYESGDLEDFVRKVIDIQERRASLAGICARARAHVARHFDRATNMERFADAFVGRLQPGGAGREGPGAGG